MVKNIGFKVSKQYYESIGFEHVSFDLNSKDGSIPINLSKPITDSKYYEYFDVVTNSGTSEHVEPFENQYECFCNIHECLKVGGIAIHIVPEYEDLPRHSNIYYNRAFWKNLVKLNSYKMIFLENIIKHNGVSMLSCCYRKEDDSPFCRNRKSFLKHIFYKENNRKKYL